MKKTLWTLNVDNYAPDITAMTYPLLRRYAEKIGADFQVINERKFPNFPVVYEKLQIYELGKNNDWNIYIDSDALVHPDLFDITEHLKKDTVLHNGKDLAGNRWKYDRFFQRDGRHIGSCNWFTIGSDWCMDLWKPLDDLTAEEAVANISLSLNEINSGVMEPSHLIDDYTLSRNIAKFGLKFETFVDLKKRVGDGGDYLWHQYTVPIHEKVRQMREVLLQWNVIRKPSVNPQALEGWMHFVELDWLSRRAARAKSVVEIGSWKGRSTAALLQACLGTVYAVDTFEGSPSELDGAHQEAKTGDIFAQFIANVGTFPNLQVVKMPSTEAARKFPDKSVDMVFIDAEHTRDSLYCDVVAWLPKCKELLCGHDRQLPGIQEAFKDLGLAWKQGPGKIWYCDLNRL
jgi:hypothetical protein